MQRRRSRPRAPGAGILGDVPRDWDAATYDRIADPQFRWGSAVLDRLPLDGTETVLDAGCGSGRVTEALAERLPGGRVIALDGSPSMIDQARGRLADLGERVRFVVADLLEPLPIDPVDAVFSTATFHWVTDHDRLFRNLAAALRPGGPLVAQCGGAGNLASVVEALEQIGADPFTDKVFASVEATTRRLEDAGFEEIRCWLHPEPTAFASLEELATFLRTVALGSQVGAMTEQQAARHALEVAGRLPALELDYVRLNISARRSIR